MEGIAGRDRTEAKTLAKSEEAKVQTQKDGVPMHVQSLAWDHGCWERWTQHLDQTGFQCCVSGPGSYSSSQPLEEAAKPDRDWARPRLQQTIG